MVMKMLTRLQIRMDEQRTSTKDIENLKKNQLKMNNTVSEIKKYTRWNQQHTRGWGAFKLKNRKKKG